MPYTRNIWHTSSKYMPYTSNVCHILGQCKVLGMDDQIRDFDTFDKCIAASQLLRENGWYVTRRDCPEKGILGWMAWELQTVKSSGDPGHNLHNPKRYRRNGVWLRYLLKGQELRPIIKNYDNVPEFLDVLRSKIRQKECIESVTNPGDMSIGFVSFEDGGPGESVIHQISVSKNQSQFMHYGQVISDMYKSIRNTGT